MAGFNPPSKKKVVTEDKLCHNWKYGGSGLLANDSVTYERGKKVITYN